MTDANHAQRHVLVFNQAAVPVTMAGGTRHVELFGRLNEWQTTIIAGNRSYLDQSPVPATDLIRPVRVIAHRGGAIGRIVNWLSYMASALVSTRHARPTVVWGSSPQMGAGLVGLMVARVRRVPFVLEVRDLWPHILVERQIIADGGLAHRLLRSVEEYLYRQAAVIVVLAEGTQVELNARGFGSKVRFVPNGSDVDSFRVDRAEAVARTGIGDDGRFVVVYAGAHGPANGLHRVLDAAERLARRGSSAHFVLVGDGVSKQQLVDDAASRGIGNVTFVDPVPKRDVASFYAVADVGLHCLDDLELFAYGVSPNKLYDYMAAGLPVITNVRGEVAALVEQAGSGLAVGPDDIADAVSELEGSSDADRQRLGASGRQFVEDHRSREASAAQIEDILNHLVRAGAP